MIRVTDTIVLEDRCVKERFVRAFGSGGQNARKDATAVELRFDIGASSLPLDMQERLVVIAGKHVTNDGVLVVVSRTFPSQAQNRDAATGQLVALVRQAAEVPLKRKTTRPRAAVREKRLIEKERLSDVKRVRAGRDEDRRAR